MGIVVTTLCLGVYNDILDALVVRFVGAVLRRWHGERGATQGRTIVMKLIVSLWLVVAWMVFMAACGVWFCELDFFPAFYGAFQAVSTVGFGDVYCSYETVPMVVAQAAVIVPGCIFFSEYASALSEAIKALIIAFADRFTRRAADLAADNTPRTSTSDPPVPRRVSLVERLGSIGGSSRRQYNSLVGLQLRDGPQLSSREVPPPIGGHSSRVSQRL